MSDQTSTPAPPSGGAPPPPAQPPVAYGGGQPPAVPYPIELEADYPERMARWRPLVQWLLVIPHFFVLAFVLFGAYFAFIAAWFAILFTRRYPRGIFDFIAGTFRWSARATGYYLFLTSAYPPFSLGEQPSYPIRARFTYPEGGIARWRVFVQFLMAIPQFFVLYFLLLAAYAAVFIAFFAVLFTGKWPPALFNFVVGTQRWSTRVNAYAYLMTERYPPFSLD